MYNGLPVNFGHLPSLFTYLLVSKKDNSKSLRIKLAYTGNIHHLKFTTFNKKKKKPAFYFQLYQRFEGEALKTLVAFQLLHITEATSTVGALECRLFTVVYELVSL